MQMFHSSNSPEVTGFVIQNKISSTTPSKFALEIFNIEVLNSVHNNLEYLNRIDDRVMVFLEVSPPPRKSLPPYTLPPNLFKPQGSPPPPDTVFADLTK